jgi:preprotein translocase subunit SecY
MLFYRVDWLCNGILVLMALVLVWAMIAYYFNSKRSDDDPQKKNYHPLAVVLAPITFPVGIVFYISFFILRVVTYGIFLILFILTLIFLPRPLAEDFYKRGAGIGGKLLEINTLLVRFFLKPWTDESEKI